MPTVIGFSGNSGDYVMVEEDITTVAAEIDRGEGLVGLTITPGQDQAFRAGPGYVNATRVAYLRDPEATAAAPAGPNPNDPDAFGSQPGGPSPGGGPGAGGPGPVRPPGAPAGGGPSQGGPPGGPPGQGGGGFGGGGPGGGGGGLGGPRP